ncbi:ribonuclease Z [Shimia abyssi]|uniref:Ribonuclease Z n=2 Tax=Shimia abyssi TaxID=1662395 RepID=A0A2P8EYH1_9RHOB|nr:ribonuclease Z [Shimia abyssi]
MISPTEARDRAFYSPNSETLDPDEIRIIACGTGMPTPRPAQAAACFLMELGNGDKFIFDIGDGSVERLFALQIPTAFLDKVFIGHLHGDHFGDIGSLFVAGGIAGRFTPLRIWGPSGSTPELGTAAAIDAMEKMFAWDLAGRLGQTDVRGFTTEVTEFDYRLEQVVFEENGVVIRSFPAIHAIDGSVSYSLEWNGLKIVFGSDTFPNKWYIENAKGADLAIHESFITVPDMMRLYRSTPEAALQVGTQIHTAPEAFGKVMSMVKPRHAVAYHFWKDHDTTGPALEAIRTTYDGPLSLAEDYMVWNVTKDEIRVRMTIIDHHTGNPPLAYEAEPVNAEQRVGYSPEIVAGKLDMRDVLEPIYEQASEALGREFAYPDE